MTEEERAELWRTQQAAQRQWARDNAARVEGDPLAAQAVRNGWQPLLDALRDARRSEPIDREIHDDHIWTPA